MNLHEIVETFISGSKHLSQADKFVARRSRATNIPSGDFAGAFCLQNHRTLPSGAA
jgi:hypothetical protein